MSVLFGCLEPFSHLKKNADSFSPRLLKVCAEWIADSPCSLLLPGRFCRGDSGCRWPGSPPASPRDECLCCQEGDWRGPVERWATRAGKITEVGGWVVDIFVSLGWLYAFVYLLGKAWLCHNSWSPIYCKMPLKLNTGSKQIKNTVQLLAISHISKFMCEPLYFKALWFEWWSTFCCFFILSIS